MPSISDTAGGPSRRRTAVRGLLEGIDLVVFDKDGTLIDFHLMWTEWLATLIGRLERETGLQLDPSMSVFLGVDPESGLVLPHGLMAATPMARIRDLVIEDLGRRGLDPDVAERAVEAGWQPPDPVLAHPLADLRVLLTTLRQSGRRLAVATSDDRLPTERTLEALGIAGLIDAIACADDGRPVKPAPDAVLALCAELGIPPSRTAVVGDAPADLRMGRAAGVGRLIGVLTGVGDRATLRPLADVVLANVAALAPMSRTG
jgi:phosphoglycolate phosphatase-like HAD superfamily hydrolase